MAQYLWLNGEIVASDKAHTSVLSRGLLLGEALFETMHVRRGKAFALDKHYQRLMHGLAVLGYASQISQQTIASAIDELYQANRLSGAWGMRLTLWREQGPRGLVDVDCSMSCCLHYFELSPIAGALSLGYSAISRNQSSPLCHVKHSNYLENALALKDARQQGYDDVLLTNTAQAICETSTANFFLIDGDRLITPPTSDGVLNGIMRQTVIACCQQAGLDCIEQSFTPSHINSSKAAFVSNAIKPLQKVRQIAATRLSEHPLFDVVLHLVQQHIEGGLAEDS